MMRGYLNTSLLDPWKKTTADNLTKLKNESAGEREQSLLRVVIVGIVLSYFLVHYYTAGIPDILSQPVVILVGLYEVSTVLVLLSFKFVPGKSHVSMLSTVYASFVPTCSNYSHCVYTLKLNV